MRSVPIVMRGVFRSALRIALQEIIDGTEAQSEVRTPSKVPFSKGGGEGRSQPALVQVGELSVARQALEGAALAPVWPLCVF